MGKVDLAALQFADMTTQVTHENLLVQVGVGMQHFENPLLEGATGLRNALGQHRSECNVKDLAAKVFVQKHALEPGTVGLDPKILHILVGS